jgi:hypothetical protein
MDCGHPRPVSVYASIAWQHHGQLQQSWCSLGRSRCARLSSLTPKSQSPYEPISRQRRFTPSTLSQMVSTCGSPYAVIDLPLSPDQPARSWEFFTNLDYELGIIRGRRPYRWTIWVRNNELCFRASRLRPSLVLNSRLCRFTPLPVWLPLQWYSSTWFILILRVQSSAR